MDATLTQYPALPAAQVGMAGWGVQVAGTWVSDGYDTAADATAAAQATLLYMAKDGNDLNTAAMRAAAMMQASELGEWSDLSKDLYGYRVRDAAALAAIRNEYWGRAYAAQGQPLAIGDNGYEEL